MSVANNRSRKGRKTLLEILGVDKAKDIIERNVALIKTIPATMHPKIVNRILGFFARAYTQDEVAEWIMERCGVSAARASLIANDQIAKASEEFRVEKFRMQGIEYVVWHHGSAEDPRKHHVSRWDGHTGKKSGKPNGLDGFMFRIDDPPVIDLKTGERGLPGRMIGCTCWLEPMQQTDIAVKKHVGKSYGVWKESRADGFGSARKSKVDGYLRMVNRQKKAK